jgi:hypothetical protein
VLERWRRRRSRSIDDCTYLMPRSERRHELAEVHERKARTHCDVNEGRWWNCKLRCSCIVDCRCEHTVLGSRDEHDGVCGLWLLWVGEGVILLIRVDSLGQSVCSGVCMGGDGDVVFQVKLSTPHVSAAARQSCGVVKPERPCGSELGHGSSRIRYAPSVWRAFPANHTK